MGESWPHRDKGDWPDVPAGKDELAKIRFQAETDEAKYERATEQRVNEAQASIQSGIWTTEFELDKAFQQAVLEVSKAGIDRARSNAELVQKGSAAIGTLYTGLLGLSFSVTENTLPLRGLLPAIFLGFSLVLSVAYLAFLSGKITYTDGPAGHSMPRFAQLNRLKFFITWVGEFVNQRAYLLRASVVSLGVGVALLPLPFLDLSFGRPSLQTGTTAVAQEEGALFPIPWPVAPNGDNALNRILYTAQVAEVAGLRADASRPKTSKEDERLFFGSVLLGGLLFVGMAAKI